MRKIGGQAARECPCEYAVRYIGGAWKILIVSRLFGKQTHRHAELKRMLRGITSKMLTEQLRELEEDGLVERTVYAEVPPRVEYRLTPLGETLLPVLQAMYAWGTKTREALVHAIPATSPQAGAAKSPRHRATLQPPATDRY
ncbi:MAG: helix-turn-helix domain-containing protein [Candidatus Acidiferrales bacterium]